MFELAVRAGLPFIQARTQDVVHFPQLMTHLVGRSATRIQIGKTGSNSIRSGAQSDKLFWTNDQIQPGLPAAEVLVGVSALECTIIALNQEHQHPEAFDAGEVPTPAAFVRARLIDQELDPEQVDTILPGLQGLGFKQALELVRLCQARYGQVNLSGVLGLRQEVFSQLRGLQVVDTAIPYYFENPEVERYLSWAGRYLLGDYDPRLRPKGQLLAGFPGTGKTTAAKHIARSIGIPLLRLDLGSIKGRYVGESEKALSDALRQVSREAPCVLLLDEVEKLFGRTNDEGTTQNLLALVLWFLAECSDRVLTVMTTNDLGAIPPELIRHGRVDGCMNIRGLNRQEAETFALELAVGFLDVKDDVADRISEMLDEEFKDCATIAHADLTDSVKGLVRRELDG